MLNCVTFESMSDTSPCNTDTLPSVILSSVLVALSKISSVFCCIRVVCSEIVISSPSIRRFISAASEVHCAIAISRFCCISVIKFTIPEDNSQ